eukprot:1160769-Pelagomonas_calceolata.AAC.1
MAAVRPVGGARPLEVELYNSKDPNYSEGQQAAQDVWQGNSTTVQQGSGRAVQQYNRAVVGQYNSTTGQQ